MNTSYGVGLIAAGEAHLIIRPRERLDYTGATPVIYCHHATGMAWTPLRQQGQTVTDANIALIMESLAVLGHPVIASDQGGASSWNSATARQRVTDALNFISAQTGCRADRVLLYGDSMGSLLALSWARANLAKVAAICCALPLPDFVRTHAQGGAPIPANIEAAWGGLAAWQAGVNAVDPMQHLTDYEGVPIQLHYSVDDPLALPADSIAFAAAVSSAEAIAFSGAGGHNEAGTFDTRACVEFLHSNA